MMLVKMHLSMKDTCWAKDSIVLGGMLYSDRRRVIFHIRVILRTSTGSEIVISHSSVYFRFQGEVPGQPDDKVVRNLWCLSGVMHERCRYIALFDNAYRAHH